MLLTHSKRHDAPITLRFHCPACGERSDEGHVWTEHQITRILGLVQVLDERMNWVRCSACERQLLSQVPAEKLASLDPDEIESQEFIRDRISPVKLALLLGAFVFAIMPVVGPLFLLAAWGPSGSSRPWYRLACRFVLILHLVAMNLLVLACVSGRK